MERKTEKGRHELRPRDDGVELENQFILRLPEEPAKILAEALQTGNLKDRLSIKLDNDLRYGEVVFDDWLLHAKIFDLPTIIECLKTIDNKNFYKSSDVCQMMICKEEADALDSEKESPNKTKRKDPNKVDKKFLWPHGITPPCKNVRKRRFRKTLKKKNVDAPEIEKEVKRLLRIDNDAVKVEYEIINEEVDKRSSDQNTRECVGEEEWNNDGEASNSRSQDDKIKMENETIPQKDINMDSDADDEDASNNNETVRGVGEHDIFGEELSSSDDDEESRLGAARRIRELEESSRLSADDSRISDFSNSVNVINTTATGNTNQSLNIVTDSGNRNSMRDAPIEFNKTMFDERSNLKPEDGMFADESITSKFGGSSSNLASSGYFDSDQKPTHFHHDDFGNVQQPQMASEEINAKIVELRRQYDEIRAQQAQKAQEIATIQNATLRQRMQETLDNLLSQIIEKEAEIKEYESML